MNKFIMKSIIDCFEGLLCVLIVKCRFKQSVHFPYSDSDNELFVAGTKSRNPVRTCFFRRKKYKFCLKII